MVLTLLAGCLAGTVPGAAKDPPGKKADLKLPNAQALAAALAAEIAAAGNAPTALGLLLGGRSMALWGDWDPRDDEFWERCDTIIAAARTPEETLAQQARKNKEVSLAHILRNPDKYKNKVFHLEGELTRLRSVEPAPYLKKGGVDHLHEGLVLADPLASSPVTVLFSKLPDGVKLGDRLKQRVAVDAVFYKKETVGDKEPRPIPLFIGRTIKPLRETGPVGPGERAKQKDLDTVPPIDALLVGVKDKTRTPTPTSNLEEFWGYSETIVLASRIGSQAFARSARENREATFAHVFNDPDHYRGKVVHVEGRLARLRCWPAPEYVKQRGVANLYEAWIFDATQGTNPWCVIFTDLPSGLDVGEKMNVPVTADGFFFKKYRYTAANDDRYTPLVIGRTLHLENAPSQSAGAFSAHFLVLLGLMIGGAVVLIGALVFGLSWWFRRADHRHRSMLASARAEAFPDRPAVEAGVNPFIDFPETTADGLKDAHPASPGPTAPPPPEEQGFHLNGS
jgi:hypothetical protein